MGTKKNGYLDATQIFAKLSKSIDDGSSISHIDWRECDRVTFRRGDEASSASEGGRLFSHDLAVNRLGEKKLKIGDDRDRTDNLRLARAALSQLSYVPVCWWNQREWAYVDSNHGPRLYQSRTLTS